MQTTRIEIQAIFNRQFDRNFCLLAAFSGPSREPTGLVEACFVNNWIVKLLSSFPHSFHHFINRLILSEFLPDRKSRGCARQFNSPIFQTHSITDYKIPTSFLRVYIRQKARDPPSFTCFISASRNAGQNFPTSSQPINASEILSNEKSPIPESVFPTDLRNSSIKYHCKFVLFIGSIPVKVKRDDIIQF